MDGEPMQTRRFAPRRQPILPTRRRLTTSCNARRTRLPTRSNGRGTRCSRLTTGSGPRRPALAPSRSSSPTHCPIRPWRVQLFGTPAPDRHSPRSPPAITTRVWPHSPPALPPAGGILAGPVVGNASTGPAFALLASGNYSEALAQLSAVTPDGGRTLDGPLLRFAQAQEDEKENRIAEARQGYVAALAGTLAGRSAIYVAIGRLSQVEGDLPGAVDAFAHAVRLNPADQTVRQELASAWAASGRVDDAFAELVAGLLVNPANATLHAAIGQLRLDADHPADAIPAFMRALQLNPAGYEVRYALAHALTRVGKLEEAATQLAMFESARREMLERRRHDIQQEVDREEAIRRGLTRPGGTP